MVEQQSDQQPVSPPEVKLSLAQQAVEILRHRQPQEELYADVIFSPDHVVGSIRGIPVRSDELILVPGHLDPLFQRGLVYHAELYKVSDSEIRHGLQRGMKMVVNLQRVLLGQDAATDSETVVLRKEPDSVCAKLDLRTVLWRPELQHPQNQQLMMQMLEQQAGSMSVPLQVQIAKKEAAKLRQSTDSSDKLSTMRTETEIGLRRMISQQLALLKFVDRVEEFRPEMAGLKKLNGKEKLVDRIRQFCQLSLGANWKELDPEQLIRQQLAVIFPQT